MVELPLYVVLVMGNANVTLAILLGHESVTQ
jgi:hypothetical protein